MALPTNTDRYGGIKENAEPIEDPQKELDAAEYNRLAEDEAQMTHTSYKVMCRFVTTVAAAPQTFQAVAGRSHKGVGAGDLPVIQKTADGFYNITWDATFTNALGEEETLSIGFSHGGVDAGGAHGHVFTLNSQNNTIAVEIVDMADNPSDLLGSAITIWGM